MKIRDRGINFRYWILDKEHMSTRLSVDRDASLVYWSLVSFYLRFTINDSLFTDTLA